MINLNQANQKNILSAEEAKNLGQQIENHEISKNIAIYTMPKRFRPIGQTQNSARSAGFLVFLAGIVLLFLIGGGLYYYFFIIKSKSDHLFSLFSSSEIDKKNIKQEKENSISQTKQPLQRDEKETKQVQDLVIVKAQEKYFQFQQALPAVNTLTAYEQVAKQYFTPNYLKQFDQQKEQINKLADKDKTEFFKLLVNQQPSYSQLKQNLKPDKMSSTQVLLLDSKNKVKIDMKKVGGQWFIDSQKGFYVVLADNSTTTLEQWLKKKLSDIEPDSTDQESVISLQQAKDADQDGLTDQEEKLLGTNINNSDTDQDGYSDYQELIHLYNPAGKGKLTNNPLIAKFNNQTFNFSFLYPAQWDMQKVDDDQSIIFKTANEQFFQVVVQPNADNLSISAWYQKQFNVQAVRTEQIIVQTDKDNQELWQGIKTDDGLTVYITPPNKDIILTITYSPGTSNLLYFSSIFEMILNSLQFS